MISTPELSVDPVKTEGARLRRPLFVVLGLAMVGLGTAGIFLPLLPTTPFLLLAAYLFARSSPRWHRWLLTHRRLGPYIHAWRNKTGFTVGQKVRIAASLTLVMGISIYFAPIVAVKCLLAGIWAFWTVMLLRQKTLCQPAAPAD
jgi:hypothetical protein